MFVCSKFYSNSRFPTEFQFQLDLEEGESKLKDSSKELLCQEGKIGAGMIKMVGPHCVWYILTCPSAGLLELKFCIYLMLYAYIILFPDIVSFALL